MPYKDKKDQAAAGRKWYLAHKKLTNARSKAWKLAHPERTRASNKAYRSKPEAKAKFAAWAREYRKLRKANREHDDRMRRPFPIITY